MKKMTQTGTATNVATFLRSVQGKSDRSGDPYELILASLKQGPASLVALAKQTELPFTDIDAALTRLQERKLIHSQEENEEPVFSLTPRGEEYAALY
ncbi:MAG: hypothetical protein QF449_15125 [Alphaproteobacteria bacterium]|jgi:DNA-binding PadR family transcriptional regulator|nr:hypothetical protein [Alphaproteobacteria bacterium]MDP6589863.1 hypothetical protein [Alphaproteobacteria bacterium]MDP6819355.1 hypothetical protein [Alphaproteobacteria bacterium]|tara:strand:- start:334 stop:624 length:291 start_codon:yes stop_codon:yes gene_type:complete